MRGLATRPDVVPDLEGASAEAVLAHMLERHHPRLALACSFQKEEAVLIDMLMRLEPTARVFTIDTGALFPETYQAWREIEQRYGLRVEIFDAQREGEGVWSATECCSAAKVDRTRARARRPRRLDHRAAPRAGADPRRHAEAHLRRAPRPLEGQPDRRLGRQGGLGLHLPPRRPLQRTARPRLRIDRLRALHPSRVRARGALGR